MPLAPERCLLSVGCVATNRRRVRLAARRPASRVGDHAAGAGAEHVGSGGLPGSAGAHQRHGAAGWRGALPPAGRCAYRQAAASAGLGHGVAPDICCRHQHRICCRHQHRARMHTLSWQGRSKPQVGMPAWASACACKLMLLPAQRMALLARLCNSCRFHADSLQYLQILYSIRRDMVLEVLLWY